MYLKDFKPSAPSAHTSKAGHPPDQTLASMLYSLLCSGKVDVLSTEGCSLTKERLSRDAYFCVFVAYFQGWTTARTMTIMMIRMVIRTQHMSFRVFF